MRSTVLASLLALVVLVMAVNTDAREATPSNMVRRHHAKVARSISQNMERDLLEKRAFSGTGTWYSFAKGALGACGQPLDPNDFIVALNEGQYGSLNAQSEHCGKTITISNGLKTTQAKVMDACPKGTQCHFGALDMTQSLFQFFNPLSVGVFPMTWYFGSNSDDSPSKASNNNNNNNNNNNDSKEKSDDEAEKKAAAKKAAAKAEKEAEEKAAAKKAEEKKKEEEKKEKEKKEKEKKEKEEKEAKEKKEKEEKEKEEKEKKKKEEKEAKIEQAQQENIASFGEIMEALNDMVVDALDEEQTR